MMDDSIADLLLAMLDVACGYLQRFRGRPVERKLHHLRRVARRHVPVPGELSRQHRPLVLVDQPAANFVAWSHVGERDDPLSLLVEIG
jgi:hypothetical protein